MSIGLAALVCAGVSYALPPVSGAGPSTAPAGDQVWKSLDDKGLAELAVKLKDQGVSANDHLRLLAGLATEKFQAASAGPSRMQWTDAWLGLAAELSPYLSASTREAMASDIQRSLADDEAAIKPLIYENLARLGRALAGLGRKEEAQTIYAQWIARSDQLQSVSPGQFLDLVRHVSPVTPEVKPARIRLVSFLGHDCLADQAKARAIGVVTWNAAATCLISDLSAGDRHAWISSLRRAFVEGSPGLAGLNISEVRQFAATLDLLGDKDGGALETAWAAQSDQWQSAKLYDQIQLAARLHKQGGAARAARVKMAEWLTSRMLATPARTRELTAESWKRFADALGGDLSAETKALWAAKVRGAFTATPEVLGSLKYRDVKMLVEFLRSLGDAAAGGVWAEWIEKTSAWCESDVVNLLGVARELAQLEAGGKAGRLAVCKHLTERYLADRDRARKVGMHCWYNFAAVLVKDMDGPMKGLWAQKLDQAFTDYKPPGDRMTQSQLAWTLKLLSAQAAP